MRRICEFIKEPDNNIAFSVYFGEDAAGDQFLAPSEEQRLARGVQAHCGGDPTAVLISEATMM